jgi:hypothetical protein
MQKARRHASLALHAPTACKRTVSGSISLPCSGFFSPFPHGTASLSVSQEYLALPDGAGCFTQDSSGPALLRILPRLQSISPTGLSPSLAQLSSCVRISIFWLLWQSFYPNNALTLLVWAPPLSLATTQGITIVFSSYGY